ncbi:MAG: hypothetical protein GX958_10140 [Desulfitobacterium sp.]|nr:hypothetical protein [Desulfitobacterium sp.]
MKKKTKKRIKMITSWVIVSLMFQFTFYYFLNKKAEAIMIPQITPVVVEDLEIEIPGTNLENLQISFGKDYLAYMEDNQLKVYNVKLEKVVFEKKPQGNNKYDEGVIYYQWLPDRDTLVYFYARHNPNPTTTVVVPIKDNQELTEQGGLTEDPNQQRVSQPKTRTEVRHNNPQITDIYTLELPPSDEEQTLPDDRFNRSIESFPAGGKIRQMVVSTFTNLIYLAIENNSSFQLMEIDIMKNVRNLNRSGEKILQMAASDKFGTLYIKSKHNQKEEIMALNGWERKVISDDSYDIILGNRNGILYLGNVQDEHLVSINSAQENAADKSLDFNKLWEGSVPITDSSRIIIGAENQIIIYDHKTAHIVSDGELRTLNLSGEDNLISSDGVQLVQITREGFMTKLKFLSLANLLER